MRKGASTFCSSGSTACPPAVAVHLRAGWSMGGVQDRYLRHDAAGDMFVGRTVSGLPIYSQSFNASSHFAADDEVVQRAKRLCFPGLPEFVEFVAEFALASLIYHLGITRCTMWSFGIRRLRNIGKRVCQSGVPTCNSMADSIMKRLEDAGVLQLLRPSDNVAACDDTLNTATEALEPPLEEPSYPVYHWGGGMHLFPEDMALPSGSAEQAWQCKDVIDLPPETTNSRKRRRGQLVWVSAATILRKQAKVVRATPANASTNPH
ncbi:hypothetical protein GQ600_4906 [Phytophthora cactorum]|nr:hypothetical protein GQ600_4906 [Phytophthora cactorum]